MKTRISTSISIMMFVCLIAMYSIAKDYITVPASPNTKGQRHIVPKTFSKPSNAIVSDTVRADSTLRPEQSVKKLDFNMYRRSMYMHRKPFVV